MAGTKDIPDNKTNDNKITPNANIFLLETMFTPFMRA
jgi:hypothetical protein